MTSAQATVALNLFLLLIMAILLYQRRWRRNHRVGVTEAEVIEGFIGIGMFIFLVLSIYSVLAATWWAVPEDLKPAADWTYLPPVADIAITVGFCVVGVRRWRRRHVS